MHQNNRRVSPPEASRCDDIVLGGVNKSSSGNAIMKLYVFLLLPRFTAQSSESYMYVSTYDKMTAHFKSSGHEVDGEE